MIGIPANGPSPLLAAGLTVSFAPTTIATSHSAISEFISSISINFSYGTLASANKTFICPGILPATG